MDDIVAPIPEELFDIEKDIDEQIGLQPMAFKNLNKSSSGVCRFFMPNSSSKSCKLGELCPLRHVSKGKGTAPVCKHWLRGLCKLSDNCQFSHQFQLINMPLCYFHTKYAYTQ